VSNGTWHSRLGVRAPIQYTVITMMTSVSDTDDLPALRSSRNPVLVAGGADTLVFAYTRHMYSADSCLLVSSGIEYTFKS